MYSHDYIRESNIFLFLVTPLSFCCRNTTEYVIESQENRNYSITRKIFLQNLNGKATNMNGKRGRFDMIKTLWNDPGMQDVYDISIDINVRRKYKLS